MIKFLAFLYLICIHCQKELDIEDYYFDNYCPSCDYSIQNYEEDLIQK